MKAPTQCFGCRKTPTEISEYVDGGKVENVTPAEFIEMYDGTYHPTYGWFTCTSCYIDMGLPERHILFIRYKQFKDYKELPITDILGKTVEEVVNILLDRKAKGELVKTNFNGVTLYSDKVTMDDAHLRIVGITKAEYDKLKQEGYDL